MDKGELKTKPPGILEIRHSQVVLKFIKEWKRMNPIWTDTQISERIAIIFNHSSDISQGYKSLTLESLTNSIANKVDITASTRETPRTAAPAVPLAPIDEGEGDRESSGSPSSPPARKPAAHKARKAARKAAKAPAPQRKPPPAKKPPVAQPPAHPACALAQAQG